MVYMIFGGMIIEYIGYRYIQVYDGRLQRTHNLFYSVFTLRHDARNFKESLETDFWIRLANGDHPDVHMILEKGYIFKNNSLTDNILAFMAFKDMLESGAYMDAVALRPYVYYDDPSRGVIANLVQINDMFNQYIMKYTQCAMILLLKGDEGGEIENLIVEVLSGRFVEAEDNIIGQEAA